MSKAQQPSNDTNSPSLDEERIVFDREDVTDSEREILLIAEAYRGHPEAGITKIVEEASSERQIVTATLGKYLNVEKIPRKEPWGGGKSVFDKTYEDLTEKQRAIVNEAILHPEYGTDKIAMEVDVSTLYSYYVYHAFSHIIEPRQEKESFSV